MAFGKIIFMDIMENNVLITAGKDGCLSIYDTKKNQ